MPEALLKTDSVAALNQERLHHRIRPLSLTLKPKGLPRINSDTDSVIAIYNKTFMFIGKAWSFTKNRFRHNLELKTDSVTESATNSSLVLLGKALSFTKQIPAQTPSLPIIVKARRFTENK